MSKALVAECDWSTWYLENGGGRLLFDCSRL